MSNAVSFGAGNTVNADRLVGMTVIEVISTVAPILGNGDNVTALIDGVEASNSATYNGGNVSLVTKACSKA